MEFGRKLKLRIVDGIVIKPKRWDGTADGIVPVNAVFPADGNLLSCGDGDGICYLVMGPKHFVTSHPISSQYHPIVMVNTISSIYYRV